jgi:type I restriction enzyme S subunit
VTPVKHICKIGNGSTPNKDTPAYWQEGHFPWLTSSSVNDDQITDANAYVTEQALLECSLPVIEPPAVLVGITGQGRTRGMAATLRMRCTINQHLAYLKPRNDNIRVDFLRSSIDNLYTYLRRDTEGGGSTKGAITCSQLGLYKVALPPPAEQKEIEASLSLEQAAMLELTKDADRSIEILQERRSALISAAVTGQIDVRGLVQEAEEQ